MQEGSLGHLLILQKDKFESKYKIYDGRRAGKIWIEFKDEALAENPKVEIITRSTYESVSRLVDISLKDKQFSELLSQIGETEKYIEWTRKNQKFQSMDSPLELHQLDLPVPDRSTNPPLSGDRPRLYYDYLRPTPPPRAYLYRIHWGT